MLVVVLILQYHGGSLQVAYVNFEVVDLEWRGWGGAGWAWGALVVHPCSLGALFQHPLSCCIVLGFLGLLFED